jgi:hypothetical protein
MFAGSSPAHHVQLCGWNEAWERKIGGRQPPILLTAGGQLRSRAAWGPPAVKRCWSLVGFRWAFRWAGCGKPAGDVARRFGREPSRLAAQPDWARFLP